MSQVQDIPCCGGKRTDMRDRQKMTRSDRLLERLGEVVGTWILWGIALLSLWAWVRSFGITWERALMAGIFLCVLDGAAELTRIRRRLT